MTHAGHSVTAPLSPGTSEGLSTRVVPGRHLLPTTPEVCGRRSASLRPRTRGAQEGKLGAPGLSSHVPCSSERQCLMCKLTLQWESFLCKRGSNTKPQKRFYI